MKRIAKTFVSGAVVSIPIIVTVYVVWAAGVWLNNLAVFVVGRIHEPLGKALAKAPGVGVLVVLGVIFLVGLAARFWLSARLLAVLNHTLERIPLVKTIYTSLRDMLRFFGGDSGEMGKVVLYHGPERNIRMLAILTNEKPVGLPADQAEGAVAIWLPMSYMLGGYMLYVPVSSVEPIDMSVEQLMKLTTTAEVGAQAILGPRGRPSP